MNEPLSHPSNESSGKRLNWKALSRQLWIPILLLALGFTGGYLAKGYLTADYAATATVLVKPAEGNPYAPGTAGQSLSNLGTEASLVSSDAVVELASKRLGAQANRSELPDRLTVVNPPNSQVLEVTFNDRTPEAAAAGANAFANAYLQVREQRATQSVQARIDNLQEARATNESALTRNLTALAKTKAGTPARSLAEQKVRTATTEASKLEGRISDLQLSQGDPGQVLSPAKVPASPTGFPSWLVMVAGAALGLLLGATIAVGRALSDRALRSPQDLEAVGYPVLSTITRDDQIDPATLLLDPDSDLPEGARLLRSVLNVLRPHGGMLLIASVDEPAAHSLVAISLASALSRSNQRVTLIDASGGHLTRATRQSAVAGLTDLLVEDVDAGVTGGLYQRGLAFIPSGTDDSHTADKLASPKLRVILEHVAMRSHWTLVAGPIATSPEALTLAEICQQVVLVASLNHATADSVQLAASNVTRGKAELLGVVAKSRSSRHRSKGSKRSPSAWQEWEPEQVPAINGAGRRARTNGSTQLPASNGKVTQADIVVAAADARTDGSGR